jgi:hypothetical protein
MANHRKAILIGVVRHDVNRSAGSSGFIGNSWVDEHAASWMQFRGEIGGVNSDVTANPWVAT